MGAIENPNRDSAAAVVVPVLAIPFTRELVQSKGVASFARVGAGQYVLVLEQPQTFQGAIPRITFGVNVRMTGGAQVLADGSVAVSTFDADTGQLQDPDAFYFSVFSFIDGEGDGPVLPVPPVPPPIPPGTVTFQTDTFIAGALQVLFFLTMIPLSPADMRMSVNGQIETQGLDYTIAGQVVAWISSDFGLSAGDQVIFYYEV